MVGHERLIKGFKCYCYIDHKNNVFSDAQLDNRRRSKKLSNWALELQQFDIERIWIRGEANILADAPSRAPWESALAQFLPIPDMPVRDLVIQMYQDPDGVEELVSKRRKVLTGDQPWEPIGLDRGAPTSAISAINDSGYVARDFGPGTPEFGRESAELAREVLRDLGSGKVLFRTEERWPRFPVCVC